MLCADTELVQLREGLLHITVPRFKQRFTLVQPTRNSLHSVMDTAKVCDSIVFLLCPHTAMDSWGETLLSSVLAQGLPCQPVFVVGSMDEIPAKKHTEVKRLLVKSLERKLPVEKVWSMQEQGEAVNILRTLGTQKRKEGSFKNRRGHLLAEKVEFTETGEGAGTLAVTGFVRGAAISANRLVHLPGWGDFQVDRIEAAPEPLRLRGAREQEMEEVEVVQRADPALRQELDCENCPDGMDGEQTWPTEEELQAADIAAQPATRKVAKVPRGMSDYQAAWIQEEGEEDQEEDEEEADDCEDGMEDSAESPCEADDDSSEDEKEEDRDCDTQTETMTEAGDGDYDAKHVNFAAEVDEMEALRTARVDSMFPDEVDTPMDVPARIRYIHAGIFSSKMILDRWFLMILSKSIKSLNFLPYQVPEIPRPQKFPDLRLGPQREPAGRLRQDFPVREFRPDSEARPVGAGGGRGGGALRDCVCGGRGGAPVQQPRLVRPPADLPPAPRTPYVRPQHGREEVSAGQGGTGQV